MECNPDDVTEDFAQSLKALPVNRVSMGIQTFSDQRLRFLRRRHTAAQTADAVKRLRHAGIGNISIDLMYGFPNETIDDWQEDIRQALALEVEHLSAYSLMYEEDTPLYRMLEQGQVKELDEEVALAMYAELISQLSSAGYEHYEISNFAKPSFHSRHNSSYWHSVPYLGLGAAAHSYDQESRQWNIDNIDEYIAGIESGNPKISFEELDETKKYNELIMTSLRTKEGLLLERLSNSNRNYCLSQARRFLDDGLLMLSEGSLSLTQKGIFVSNMIMSDLMMVSPQDTE
jgi:oxygen-independent coproporphyrinogen-3 oxidase